MPLLFYPASAVALLAAGLVVTGRNAVHALLYLVVSQLALAAVFFSLGAPFAAALEVIVYSGAIMVLILFVVMMLNLGSASTRQEAEWTRPRTWAGPGLLTLALAVPFFRVLAEGVGTLAGPAVPPRAVSLALFGPYVLGVELASMVLLAGLVAANHIGRRTAAGEEGL